MKVIDTIHANDFVNDSKALKSILCFINDETLVDIIEQIILKQKDFETVKIILNNTAKRISSESYNRSLRMGCANGNMDLVKFAIDNKANVNWNDGLPAFVAVNGKHFGIIKYLADNGIRITYTFFLTLWEIIKLGKFDVACYMLGKGLGKEINNNDMAEWLCENNRIDILKDMINQGYNAKAIYQRLLKYDCFKGFFYTEYRDRRNI